MVFHLSRPAVQNLARHGILLVENTADFGIQLAGWCAREHFANALPHDRETPRSHFRPYTIGPICSDIP